MKAVWDNPRWVSGAWRFVKEPDGRYSFVNEYYDGNGSGPHDTTHAGRVDVAHATVTQE